MRCVLSFTQSRPGEKEEEEGFSALGLFFYVTKLKVLKGVY